MRHISEYITEAYSLAEAKRYLFSCLDKTDDYNFEVTLETCPLLAEYYCLSELSLSREFKNHPEYIYLALIVVNEEDQYSGYGTGFMEDLCEWADSRGKIITLTPDDDFGASSVSRLVKFYKRFGFVENKGKNTDFTHKQYMHRKPNVTEAVARRTSGKYRNVEVTAFPDNPMYDDIMDWIKYNGIKINDIGNYNWKDIDRNMGKGVALKGHGYVTHDIILCPIRDHEHAYCFKFKNGEDEIYEVTLYSRSSDGVYGQSIWVSQIIGYINDLDMKHNFITEAVARRTTGKYGITVTDIKYYPAPTYSELLEWVKDNRIRTVDIANYDWMDIRKNMGNGVALLCHNSISKEIILCPVEDNGNAYGFRFTLDGNMDEAILYERTARSISGRNKTTQQLIGYVNDLKREGNFITEAVARRTTGKYTAKYKVEKPVTRDKFLDWLNSYKINPDIIDSLSSTEYGAMCNRNIGKGKCFDITQHTSADYKYALFPKFEGCGLELRFDNRTGELQSAIRMDKTHRGGIVCTNIGQDLVLDILNDEEVMDMFEAVARRTTGKYDFHLSVDTKKNDFESFVMSTPLDIEELVATPTFIQDVDENSFGTGKCYVNRSKARNHTEYILCPEGKNFRYTILFDNDDMVQALRTDKYGSAVRTDFRKDKATVLKEIEDYYN